jgi:hypothetical protein
MEPEEQAQTTEIIPLEDVIADISDQVELRADFLDRVEIRYATPGEALWRVYHRDEEEYESGYVTG